MDLQGPQQVPGWLSPVSTRGLAAVRPSMPGRSVSRTATSGRVSSAAGWTWSPPSSSATTCISARKRPDRLAASVGEHRRAPALQNVPSGLSHV